MHILGSWPLCSANPLEILGTYGACFMCCAPFHKDFPKHHGQKGDPGVILGTCDADGEKAQVILVWLRAPRVGNASHPQGLVVMRVRP